MPNTSRAAVFAGVPGQIELRSIPIPELAAGQILVKVESCTLCGSDLHSIEGRRKVPVPTILGHEIVGRIVAFADDALRQDACGRPLEIGSRVVWSLVASCGTCFYCARGLPQKCSHSIKYGHEAFRPGLELLGGLAEHCLLVRGTTMISVPDELSPEVLSPASCATATIAAALENVLLKERSVLIAGAGLLGLTACAMARHQGADSIVVCDIDPQRQLQALQFGATQSVAPEDVAEAVRMTTNSYGIDLVLELSGAPSAFQILFPQIRLGGTLILAGAVFPSEPVPVAMEQIVRRNLILRGIHNYRPENLLQAVDFLNAAQNVFPFHSLVAEWFTLPEIEQALAAAKKPGNIRVGIRPSRFESLNSEPQT